MERDTSQRRAIRRVFEMTAGPLTPQEIREEAQAHVPALGLATVYRTLKGLMEEAFLVAVEIPGEPVRYELAGKSHHHHFHCRECGRVFEVEGCPGNLRNLTPPGFLIEDHEILLYGRCETCTITNEASLG